MSDPYVLKNGVFILKGGKAGSGIPLESHVIPHGNSSVGAKLDELSQNLTSRYNEETDYYQAKINGVWVNDRRGYLQALKLWYDGQFGVEVANGQYRPNSYNQPIYQWLVNGDNLYSDIPVKESLHTTNFVTENQVNLNNYRTITVNYIQGGVVQNPLVLNVADLSTSAYIVVAEDRNNTINTLSIYVSSSKANWCDSAIRNTYGALDYTKPVTITSIIAE